MLSATDARHGRESLKGIASRHGLVKAVRPQKILAIPAWTAAHNDFGKARTWMLRNGHLGEVQLLCNELALAWQVCCAWSS